MWTGSGSSRGSGDIVRRDVIPAEFLPIWTDALPFLGVRQNDEHTRYSTGYADRLVTLTGANRAIAIPAIILHDTGWSTVPEHLILESFGPKTRYPELRRQHEVEGAAIARRILERHRYPGQDVDLITGIIDGHDTRAEAISLEDAVVKDADKLWRYTRFGLETIRGWFGHTVAEQLALLDDWGKTRLFTEPGRHMALGLLEALHLEDAGRR